MERCYRLSEDFDELTIPELIKFRSTIKTLSESNNAYDKIDVMDMSRISNQILLDKLINESEINNGVEYDEI